ncbi:hypothetical protein [Sphingopyxis sp.]|uniref:hypothetical protein n=1 Tax=Sphingopyxis sp. TaxID=1908224 RepID=UPI003D09EFA1
MSDDAMVPIAELVSRSEALTVAAMLDAAGIIVHVGGEHYAGSTLEVLAIGGFRLTVPASQHEEASAILREYLAEPVTFSDALRRRVLMLVGIVGLTISLPTGYILFAIGELTPSTALMVPLSMLATPVSPQGRGDYYLIVEGS